jgi:hypothetical protein
MNLVLVLPPSILLLPASSSLLPAVFFETSYMETICPSETSVTLRTTQRYSPEHSTHHGSEVKIYWSHT